MTTSKLMVETAKELELFFKENAAPQKNDPALQRVTVNLFLLTA